MFSSPSAPPAGGRSAKNAHCDRHDCAKWPGHVRVSVLRDKEVGLLTHLNLGGECLNGGVGETVDI